MYILPIIIYIYIYPRMYPRMFIDSHTKTILVQDVHSLSFSQSIPRITDAFLGRAAEGTTAIPTTT